LVREVQEETGLKILMVNSFAGSFDYHTGAGKLARQLNFEVEDDSVSEVSTSPKGKVDLPRFQIFRQVLRVACVSPSDIRQKSDRQFL